MRIKTMIHVIELNRFLLVRVSREAGTIQVITRSGFALPVSRRTALNALAKAGVVHRGLNYFQPGWRRTWGFVPAP
jgi:hypothetical protein